jgi:hypothetical protein
VWRAAKRADIAVEFANFPMTIFALWHNNSLVYTFSRL